MFGLVDRNFLITISSPQNYVVVSISDNLKISDKEVDRTI